MAFRSVRQLVIPRTSVTREDLKLFFEAQMGTKGFKGRAALKSCPEAGRHF